MGSLRNDRSRFDRRPFGASLVILTPAGTAHVIQHSPYVLDSIVFLCACVYFYSVLCVFFRTSCIFKALRETQTLRAGCSKAEPKIFAPPQTPFPGAHDGQNLISRRRSLPTPTDLVWWRSTHAFSSYRGDRYRPPAVTNPQTGPITIHCAAAS